MNRARGNLIIVSPASHLSDYSISRIKHTYCVNHARDYMFTALTHAIKYRPRDIPKPTFSDNEVSTSIDVNRGIYTPYISQALLTLALIAYA
jgi:hypothetical protein